MEPVTHFLTGACIGRAGLNRKTAYATLAAVLAAEAADVDVLWGLRGPIEELKHHRGITHTFIAVPVIAGVVVAAIWLLNRWRTRRRNRRANALGHDSTAPSALQPVQWGWLYLTTIVAALSHLLLDWANNYGLRPFYPFNSHWYAGSFVFIAEPVIWALLLMALIPPWIFGLVDREIGVRRKPFCGRRWAIFALAEMVLLGGWRLVEQAQARTMLENTQIAAAPVKRTALEPYPINLYRWHAILETAAYYQTAEINTWTGEIASDPHQDVIYKPPVTAAAEAAKRTPLGQVYLDWGTWAVVRDVGPVPAPGMAPPQVANRQWTTVEFYDLRFAYSYLNFALDAGRTPLQSPLSGWGYIVDGRDDAGEALNGRQQR